ncbi:MAG: hypothetical protein ABI666_10295 [Ferruginibacter sp.]
MKHSETLLLIFSLIISLASCYTKPPVVYSIPEQDSIRTPFKISINKLATDFKFWQGQTIETEGILHIGFEEFTISPNKDFFSKYSDAFWLNTNQKLNIDYDYLQKASGRRIRIKGVVDTSRKGHLSSYLATIDHIYFLEVQ